MATTYPDATAQQLAALCVLNLRTPETIATDTVTGDPVLTFNPVLTSGEQATFADLLTMAKFGIASSLTLAEFQAMKADLATDKAFVGIASPTLAQNNAATKSLIKIVGALLRQ